MMDAKNSTRSKIKIAVYCVIGAAILILLQACTHQISVAVRAVRSSEVYAVDVDAPGPFAPADLARFVKALRSGKVKKIRESNLGTWGVRKGLNLRGRLDGGKRVLLKRRSRGQLQSEIYSYYLNCYLDMWNAPPTALGCINKHSEWTNSTNNDGDTACYVISLYVEGLTDEVYIPDKVQEGIDLEAISTTPRELNRLMEWSDMILFDFMSGHTDRLSDNLFLPHINLHTSLKQVPNMAKVSSGELILIDHEATFHTAYHKARASVAEQKRQSHYLARVYVFRRHTVERACMLCSQDDPATTLERFINNHDPISLSIASQLSSSDRESFRDRLSQVCSRTCGLLKDSRPR